MTTVPRESSRLRSLLVALAAGGVALLCAGPPALGEGLRGPVVDPVGARSIMAQQRWQQVAAGFDARGTGPDQLFVAADAASTLAQEVRRAGWTSPEVPPLVDAVVAAANPDGGWGLARDWDAYQDGTVNPATTSYTATTAGHVGPILLEGYRAGVVPAPVLHRTIDWLLDLPRPTAGVCVPYSASAYDLDEACVWNVHFGAAAWVKRASTATGYRTADAEAFAARAVSVLATLHPDPVTGYLPYSSSQTRPQDIGHQLWTAAAIDELRGDRTVLTGMVSRPFWRAQAGRFRDYNVASAMSGIALRDCRFAIDPTVLRYAASSARGNPYAFKALAAQARQVSESCFPASGRVAAARTPGSTGSTGLVLPDLG